MNRNVDLQQLAIERAKQLPAGTAAGNATVRPKTVWVTRYLIPGAVVAGFLVLLAAAAGRQWWPTRSVTVVPVIVRQASTQAAGTRLFQAAGWIEPRPTAVNVPALAAGIIKELLVVEGERVEAGQPIARLIDVDAQLAVQRAEAQLAVRESELERAIAVRDAATVRLQQPVHLEAVLADAESQLALGKTEQSKLSQLIDKARAQLTFAEQSLASKQQASEAVAGIVVRQAKAEYASAAATLEELLGREPTLRENVAALRRRTEALRRQVELLVDEKQQLREAAAGVNQASAQRDEAQVALAEARLNLERMTVRAPIAGKILMLVSFPGDRVMGIDNTSEHRSSTVVQAYDPQCLQVRADVRLEDVPLVVAGQPVEIQTASSPEPMQGRVLQSTSAANVQKNTLEVKVALIDPPATVTPEMLVTATFLAPADAGKSAVEPSNSDMLLVPQQLIQNRESTAVVWVVDAASQAMPRQVELGSPHADGLVEIRSGLNPADKLISGNQQDLVPGERVAIAGDDPTLGL